MDKHWSAHNAVVLAYVPGQATIVRAVDRSLSIARSLCSRLYNAVACSSWTTSAQMVVALYALQRLTCLLSVPTILWMSKHALYFVTCYAVLGVLCCAVPCHAVL